MLQVRLVMITEQSTVRSRGMPKQNAHTSKGTLRG